MRQYLEDLDAGFDETEFTVERIENVDAHRILYRGRVNARGNASGAPIDAQVWGLWEIRDRKLIRGVAFLTKREALEAAGISQ
jgi:ketosteroid isomerase-like protein